MRLSNELHAIYKTMIANNEIVIAMELEQTQQNAAAKELEKDILMTINHLFKVVYDECIKQYGNSDLVKIHAKAIYQHCSDLVYDYLFQKYKFKDLYNVFENGKIVLRQNVHSFSPDDNWLITPQKQSVVFSNDSENVIYIDNFDLSKLNDLNSAVENWLKIKNDTIIQPSQVGNVEVRMPHDGSDPNNSEDDGK